MRRCCQVQRERERNPDKETAKQSWEKQTAPCPDGHGKGEHVP